MRPLVLAFVLTTGACSESPKRGVASGGTAVATTGSFEATGNEATGTEATSGTTSSLPSTGTGSSASTGGGTSQGAGQTSGQTSGAFGTTGGGGAGDGGIKVTFTTVDVHPAARAALQRAGLPIPELAGYALSLIGVGLSTQGPVLSPLYSQTISASSQPYAFSLTSSDLQLSSYGVLVSITQGAPASGPPGGASNAQLTCPQLAQLRGLLADGGSPGSVQSFFADAGGSDYFMVTASQLTGLFLKPAADVLQAAAYAVPASYAAILNCAGQPEKTLRDTDQGLALVYVSGGRSAGQGAPLAGVSFAVEGAQNAPTVNTYRGDYSSTSNDDGGGADAGTDSSGVATAVNVALGFGVPYLAASNAQGTKFFDPEIATQPSSIFDVFVVPSH